MHILTKQYLARDSATITSGNTDSLAMIPVGMGKADANPSASAVAVVFGLSHVDRDPGRSIPVSACDRRVVLCQVLLNQDVHHHVLLQRALCRREYRYQASPPSFRASKYFKLLCSKLSIQLLVQNLRLHVEIGQ